MGSKKIIIFFSIVILTFTQSIPAKAEISQNYADIHNSRNTIDTRIPYYVSWRTNETTFLINDYSLDRFKNVYVSAFDPIDELFKLISYDIFGRVRWTYRTSDEIVDHRASFDGQSIYTMIGSDILSFDVDGNRNWIVTIERNQNEMLKILSGTENQVIVLVTGNCTRIERYSMNGKLMGFTVLDGTYGSRCFHLTSGNDLILDGKGEIISVDTEGRIKWNLNISISIDDTIMDQHDNLYLASDRTMIIAISKDGLILWTRPEHDDQHLSGMINDSSGDLIVCVYGFIDHWTINATVERIDRSGKTLWIEESPYANGKPTIDSQGNILVGGLGDIALFDENGKILWYHKDDEIRGETPIRRSDIAILDERTMVTVDFDRIICYVAVPYDFKIETSQGFGNEIVVDIIVEKIYYDNYPDIRNIILRKDHTYSRIREDILLHPETRSYSEIGRPYDEYRLTPMVLLEDGCVIEGKSLDVRIKDQTYHYIAVGTIGSVILISIIFTLYFLYIHNRKKNYDLISGIKN